MTAMPVFLVVEPSSLLRSLLRTWLEDVLTEHRILTAATGDHALHLAAQEQPTHLLTELNLPDVPGIQLLQQMRRGLPAATIIATHWYESRCYFQSAYHAGANGFIPKHKLHIELLPLMQIKISSPWEKTLDRYCRE
jgi:DNA-binding NarL/FixJ family response regulator